MGAFGRLTRVGGPDRRRLPGMPLRGAGAKKTFVRNRALASGRQRPGMAKHEENPRG